MLFGLLGFGMYLPYAVFHTTVFERMIAAFSGRERRLPHDWPTPQVTSATLRYWLERISMPESQLSRFAENVIARDRNYFHVSYDLAIFPSQR